MTKPIKKGLKAGSPPDAPLLWAVYFLDVAGWEAKDFLTDCQYEHVVDALRSLASDPDPRRPQCEDVSPIEAYYELRLKGGLLGKINLRVFFQVLDHEKAILVLHAWKKEAERQTPSFVKRLVRSRLRSFAEGKYGALKEI
jgi:hypothetical protein